MRVAATARGAELELASGRTLHVDHVVLALGNPPPRRLGDGAAGVIEDPWAPFALDAIGPHDPLVLVGSGLTAIDIALQLFARGRSAPIEMISRHGLLPRVHASHTPVSAEPHVVSAPTARGLLRNFRTAVAEAGGDWQAVMKSIRPRTNELWAALPEPERARLLRHVSRHWDVHRHRMAPQIAAQVEHLIATGRLRVSCGVVTEARDLLDPGEVPHAARRGNRARRDGWVVNCTGPNYDLRGSSDELIRHLLGSGAARPGHCGLGLDATADGRLVGRDGLPSAHLSTIGPLRRGPMWETTAIPEIRSQAEALARPARPRAWHRCPGRDPHRNPLHPAALCAASLPDRAVGSTIVSATCWTSSPTAPTSRPGRPVCRRLPACARGAASPSPTTPTPG